MEKENMSAAVNTTGTTAVKVNGAAPAVEQESVDDLHPQNWRLDRPPSHIELDETEVFLSVQI
jgi:hypothetical protein